MKGASHVPKENGGYMTFDTPGPGPIWIRLADVGARWHFKAAGYIGWLAIAVPSIADISAGDLRGPRALLWAVAFAAFGAIYATYLRPDTPVHRRRSALWSLAALTGAALTMVLTSIGLMKYLASVALTIVAGELPYVLSRRRVWIWITMQSVVLALIFWYSFGWVSGLAGGSAYAGFQIVALGKTWTEQRERLAREELARANADLRATRALYAESSRVAERLRISRDLHDSLGHHLTALSLQLDVAARTSAGPAAQQIQQAHAITRLLLSDVRDVVGQLRDQGRIELSEAMRSLANATTLPRIHVDAPDTLAVDTPAAANVLLRCAQEVVTNAIRHAGAQNIWIAVSSTSEGVELYASDDGAGADPLVLGHGLNGMRERFAEYGGRVEFSGGAGHGFTVHAYLPQTPSV
jgi:signal transduction histidine kinase